ncbi:MAG: P1 family peptidase, partial [Pseudomonadota bacterium]
VVIGDTPMTATVDVRGGAPGTAETDLLAPGRLVTNVDAIVLSGGSAFGLAAGDAVRTALARDGRGFEAAGHRVPIVPAAILFDLANGGEKAQLSTGTLYRELGAAAYAAANAVCSSVGSCGAGYGATTATLRGGVGTASARFADGTTIAALVAVNPFGSPTVAGTPHFWAAPWERIAEFGGQGPAPAAAHLPERPPVTKAALAGQNTTIGIVATDAALSRPALSRLAVGAHDGYARAIVPSHTPFDGDLVFALSTGESPVVDDPISIAVLSAAAADVMARAVARGVYAADPWPDGAAGPPCYQRAFPRMT